MIYIMRGLPGSGKDTYAKAIQNCKIIEADFYHTWTDGTYRFDPAKAGYAHASCFGEYLDWLASKPLVNQDKRNAAICNTNTSLAEIAPYVLAANAYGWEYKIIYLVCSIETAVIRNTHKVPINTILAMNRNLLTEVVPPYWNQEVLLR